MITIRLPFTTTAGQPLALGGDIGGLDANAYVEPMELYDSIFWGESVYKVGLLGVSLSGTNHTYVFTASESPDPWNSGVDAMSFDFLAQPPPGQPPQQQFYF